MAEAPANWEEIELNDRNQHDPPHLSREQVNANIYSYLRHTRPGTYGNLALADEQPGAMQWGGRPWLNWGNGAAFAALYVTLFMLSFSHFSWSSAVTFATNEFNDIRLLGWHNTIYVFSAACFVLTFGRIYLMFNVKLTYHLVTFVYIIGCFLSAVPTSRAMALVGRFISGLGAAGMSVGMFHILPLTFHLRVHLMGNLLGTAILAALVLSPVVGGVISQSWGWRMCFYLSAPVVAFCNIVVSLTVRAVEKKTNDRERSFRDKVVKIRFLEPFVAVPLICVPFMYFNFAATTKGMNDFIAIALLTVTGTIIALVAYVQYRYGYISHVPRHFFAKPSIYTIASLAFFTGAALSTINFYLPLWFSVVKGLKSGWVGVLCLPWSFSVALGAMAGILSKKSSSPTLGYLLFGFVGCIIYVTGAVLIAFYNPSMPVASASILAVSYGAGIGLLVAQPFIVVSSELQEEERYDAYLILAYSALLGSAIYLSASNVFYDNRLIRRMEKIIPREEVLGTGLTDFSYRYPITTVLAFISAHNVAITSVLIQIFILGVLTLVFLLAANIKALKLFMRRRK